MLSRFTVTSWSSVTAILRHILPFGNHIYEVMRALDRRFIKLMKYASNTVGRRLLSVDNRLTDSLPISTPPSEKFAIRYV